MSGVAAAVGIGAAVVSTGVQMYGSSKSAKAQNNALQQQGSTSQGNYAVDQGLYQPYIDSGTNALGQLQTGLARPMTDAQFAQAQQEYQASLGEWNNTEARYNDMASRYNMLDANGRNAVGNSPEGFVAYFDKALSDKYNAGRPVEPTNEGRGELSQRTNMTPQDYFASEAAAGRPVSEADQNWNKNFNTNEHLQQFGLSEADMYKNFDQAAYLASQGKSATALNENFNQAAYLASQGKSATALNENFDMNAWLAGQGRASNALTRDFAMSDYTADPGYQFRLDQGNRGIEASAAARGGSLSGATMKALSEFNQGQASQEYQNSVNRFNTNRGNLQGVAYNAQGQFINDRSNLVNNTNNANTMFNTDRSNLVNNTNNAATQFGNDRSNLINNVDNEYNRFNTNQNKLYGKFTDAYGRQANAKQTDFSNMYNMSGQGLTATNQLAQAGQNNTSNQMGVQAGQGNVQAQQSNANANALSGLAGTVGSVVGKYYSNQPLATGTTPQQSNLNALTQSSYITPNFGSGRY